jgi:23S rRNA (guanosine2251-2'-O)-methyltransferase
MRLGCEVKRIPANAAQSMSKNGNHQGYLAEVDEIAPVSLKEVCQKEFVVVLSGITDVGNIGAIVRSAYALGVDAVVVCGLKNLALEPIVRSSTGALFDLPFVVQNNLYDVINDLKLAGFDLYGAVMDGEDIRNTSMSPKRALLLGNEAEGIPARAQEKLDRRVSIAMAHDFDSLNVSAAGAILMDRMR